MAKQGFIGSLFDFSFSNFVTPTLIKIIYGLALLMVGLAVLGIGITGLLAVFGGEAIGGILMIIIGCPLYLVFGTIGARVYCELLILFFRILETLIDIKANTAS
ncbi:MAG: DUF4282 domain-containing protein [Proteobacteria bacterium]|nr:DUF4282 domain-containing protein [Pseudomonadota bacterium]